MVTAEQLRAARAILQMDQAELAKLSGVSVETIKRLERQTGKLHAKIETIIAIRKAFEAQHLEFLGDHDGRGAGVRLVHPDNLQLMREALTGEVTHTLEQWLKAQCATDPKFFEHGEKRVTQALTKLSARILPTIVRSVLSVVVTHADSDHYEGLISVRRRASDPTPEEDRALIESANRATPRAMSAPERAMADAHHLTSAMLGLIQDAGDDLLGAGNRDFTRAFVAAIPASERGALTNAEGGLSAEGIVRARNAILAKAYGNADVLSRITESTDDEIKSISNALLAAAPQWAKFRADIKDGRVRADVDETPFLIEAVKRTADIRARGQKLGDYLRQIDAFCDLTMPVENWMQIFYDPFGNRTASTQRVKDALEGYTEQARKVAAAMSAAERARADAHYLTPAMLGLIQDADDLSAAGNRAFTRAFIAAIAASERGALTNAEGGLSAEGIVRARNAILAKAYGNADVLSRITESTDDEIKSISNALVAAAPQWAKFRADIEASRIRADVDATDDLIQAVKQTADIRDRGQKLQEFLADAVEKLPVGVELWMRLFYDPFRKGTAAAPRIAESLRSYVEEAVRVSNDPRFEPEVTGDKIQSNVLSLLGRRRA
jgi:transcriptional regulator with XRE-family HTH domain